MNLEYPLAGCRKDFPQLTQRIRGKSLVYLDSAATGLKPWAVIERVGHLLTYQTANVHRGAHFLANQATEFYEGARETTAKFLGCEPGEIVFTRGTTESINLVASSWGSRFLQTNDVIVLSELEHHSNIVPWQMIAQKTGALIKVIRINDRGELDLGHFQEILAEKNVKLVAVTHASNALGTVTPMAKIVDWAHRAGALVLVDGAQMVANHRVDVRTLGADFYVFSGHKLFAPFGIGVLFGKKELLDSMPPYQGGGSMIHEVTFQSTTYHDVPHRFEAGTPNVEGAVGLAAAIDYLESLGWERIQIHERSLLLEATKRLSNIEGLKIVGTSSQKVPVLSFCLRDQHPADVGQIIDQASVAIRAGHHCAQPLMKRLGVLGTLRASFSIYNSSSDIDQLVLAIEKAKELLL